MVSDLARLTKTLRSGYTRATAHSSDIRAKMREDLPRINSALRISGEAIFTDANGNRFLIKREPANR